MEFMSQGQLVPDQVTIEMLRNKVDSMTNVKGFIYDGFPRTTPQAQALDQMLKEKNESIAALIALHVDDDEIVRRILNRGLSSGRQDDSDESIIRNRMEEYRKKTSVVYDYYKAIHKSHTIDGFGSIDEIFENVTCLLDDIIVNL